MFAIAFTALMTDLPLPKYSMHFKSSCKYADKLYYSIKRFFMMMNLPNKFCDSVRINQRAEGQRYEVILNEIPTSAIAYESFCLLNPRCLPAIPMGAPNS